MNRWLASALILAILPGSLWAWRSQQDPGQIIRARVELVNVLTTVRDRRGNYVEGLERTDFEILEDGVRQEIEFFAYESGEEAQPLTITLLMDTSGSVKDKLRFEQRAAVEFFQEVLRQNKDLAAVLQFDSDINLVQDFTFDINLLQEALGSVRAGGATKLYDAIYVAVDQLLRNQFGRRVIVVLSDGQDTNSAVTKEESIRLAQEQDVIIFGIGVQSERSNPRFGVLKNFAESTGGAFFSSKVDLQRLRDAFRQINNEIKNQYSLGYVSKNRARDGAFREIQVKVQKRGIRVGHRKGYYAPRPSSEAGNE